MHITLRHLRIFEAVAKHGSASHAARELHLTQPAVSMQMKQLEAQIGRRLCLTEAGQALRVHAEDIAARIEELNASMEQFRGLERGPLRLAVVSTENYFLPALIASFNARHPGVRVSLRVASRAFVLSAWADSNTDLAIIGQPPDNVDTVAQQFKDNPLVVIATPGHELVGQGQVTLQRLAQKTLVVREPGSGTRAAAERHVAAQGLAIRAGCEFGTHEAITQAVRAGLGLAVVSVEGFPIVRQCYVAHRAQQRLSVAASTFRSMLVALDPARPPGPPRRRVTPSRVPA